MLYSAVSFALFPSTSWAEETAIETLVKRGIGLALWIAVGVFGVLGIIIFCDGARVMADSEDPQSHKKGRRRMLWGAFLTIAVLVAVAIRDYLTAGLDLSSQDLNPFIGGVNPPASP